jgi:hypothetical protein
MLTFEEWLLAKTPEGHTHQDEVRHLYLQIEATVLRSFGSQVDRRKLFLSIARKVYEYSEMTTQYNVL